MIAKVFRYYSKRGVLMKTIDDLSLRDNEKKAIAEATRTLKEKFPIKEVILFGSKARGDDDEDSDIDLFLLTTRQIHWKEREAIVHALFDIGMEHDVIFSILDATVSSFENGIFTAFPVYDEITRDGVMAK
jgi:predicted nucleotidyltransferase